MRLNSLITDTVPIYDINGQLLDAFALPESICPAFRRRGGFSASGVYYKGAGILYSGHVANQVLPNMLQTGDIKSHYQKYHVLYPHLYGKFGIFTFPHQPVFSDFEGGCGPKEENLLRLQRVFHFSAIDGDVETISTPLPGHQVYAYRLKELSGGYRDALRLLEYVLSEDFNCPWDKNIWGDLCCYGYVRDLADWFISAQRCHKLGTAYAFLNSIVLTDKYLYQYMVEQTVGLGSLEPVYLPYIAACIVEHFCPRSMPEHDLEDFSAELYGKLLRELYMGKACCHLEDEAFAVGIREKYLQEIPEKISAMARILGNRKDIYPPV